MCLFASYLLSSVNFTEDLRFTYMFAHFPIGLFWFWVFFILDTSLENPMDGGAW